MANNFNAPSKEAQVEALVHGRAYKLLSDVFDAEYFTDGMYKEVFTVNKTEVLEYVRNHYSLKALVYMKAGTDDGLYIIPRPFGGFDGYYQEREIKMDHKQLKSENEAWGYYVQYILDTSGTGLKF